MVSSYDSSVKGITIFLYSFTFSSTNQRWILSTFSHIRNHWFGLFLLGYSVWNSWRTRCSPAQATGSKKQNLTLWLGVHKILVLWWTLIVGAKNMIRTQPYKYFVIQVNKYLSNNFCLISTVIWNYILFYINVLSQQFAAKRRVPPVSISPKWLSRIYLSRYGTFCFNPKSYL